MHKSMKEKLSEMHEKHRQLEVKIKEDERKIKGYGDCFSVRS